MSRLGSVLRLEPLVVLALACGEESWHTTGVVDQLLIPDHQVVIAHDDIPVRQARRSPAPSISIRQPKQVPIMQ